MKTIRKPINMLCQVLENGKTIPLRFKVETKDEGTQVITIKNIHKEELHKIAGIKTKIYKCIVYNETWRVQRECELRYDMDKGLWTLHSI